MMALAGIEPIFSTYDYVIGGKMVVGSAELTANYAELMQSDYESRQQIKQYLIQQMAQYILENNLVEFTQLDDPITGGKRIKVRAYLAPNDQVKILRVANKLV
jgi:hypothetical protein